MPKQGGGLKLQDDSGKSTYAEPPKLESGGGGLVSTMHDYMRFCRMMLGGGTLDGVQILSPKTVELFSLNLLPDNKLLSDMSAAATFNEAGYGGIGFSIGCGVTMDQSADTHSGYAGRVFLGRRGIDRILDRPEGRPDRRLHDAGHGYRRAADAHGAICGHLCTRR